jgi:hypothetical protein
VDLAPVSWAASDLDATDADSADDIERIVSEYCRAVRLAEGRPTVVRLALSGRSPAHAALARSGTVADLHEALRRDEAAAEPWLWIDRLEDRTSTPIDLDALRAGQDFAAEIMAVADELAVSAVDMEALVAEVVGPVSEKMRGFEPTLAPDELLALARDRCLDGLLTRGDAR